MKKFKETDKSKEIVEKLEKGKLAVGELDLSVADNVVAIDEYYKTRTVLLRDIADKELLRLLVQIDPMRFIYLDKKQQEIDVLAKFFLAMRLNEAGEDSPYKTITKLGYDGNLTVTLEYETHDGEQITYFDPELRAPLQLASKAVVNLKFKNPAKFLEKIDYSSEYVGYDTICEELTGFVNQAFRQSLIELLDRENLTYYKLNSYFEQLQEDTIKKANSLLAGGGVEVTKLIIRNINIPNNTCEILEKQFFEINHQRAIQNASAEYERISLDNYERKAAIHAKYPNSEQTLTEAEKDNALRRFIIKQKGEEEKIDVTHMLLQNRESAKFEAVDKPIDLPKRKQKKSGCGVFLLIFGLVLLLASLGYYYYQYGLVLPKSFEDTMVIGLAGGAVLGLLLFIIGIIATACRSKKKVYETEEIKEEKVVEETPVIETPATEAPAVETTASDAE